MEPLAEVIARTARAEEFVLLLDYDGTLVPLVRRPEMIAPDDALKGLLSALAKRPRTEVHLVSGRMRSEIERWFGDLPIGLHADHGYWSRPSADAEWRTASNVSLRFLEVARPILDRHVRALPGTFIEEKSVSLAWHYRGVEGGEAQARILTSELQLKVSAAGGEVLPGSKVVEVRPRGVSKALIPAELLRVRSAMVIAVGDDRTDEDLFRALPPTSIAIHVGEGESIAPYRLREFQQVRALLSQIALVTRGN